MPNAHKLELLAPARNAHIAIQALRHGADAVYIGAEAFGARSAAPNSVGDIAKVADYAHKFDARVYVTLNTLLYDNELREAQELIRRLYAVGVDALIVQDLAVLRMDIPPIALHASTQCDARTPEKAKFLQDCGFSQIVLPRELSLEQIKQVADVVSVPLEVFVHGALCVSYSGDCQASFMANGRSANRGECAQMCRLPYSLTDKEGNVLAPERHYLSLRDLNRLHSLGELVAAGVSSFKIEGRLKDDQYVRTAVAAYSGVLNAIVGNSSGELQRSSQGVVELNFEPDVSKVFNRGFTNYFLHPHSTGSRASILTPKWVGVPVGSVLASNGNRLKVKVKEPLLNGDGLGYFDDGGKFNGFRVNRVQGQDVFLTAPMRLAAGTRLYRNRSKAFDDLMAQPTATRLVPLTATLRRVGENMLSLELCDGRGRRAEAAMECVVDRAMTPQRAPRHKLLARTGNTDYTISAVDDLLPDDAFVPASKLSDLRRMALCAYADMRAATYAFDYRRAEELGAKPFTSVTLTRHDNVANHLAKRFYEEHGFEVGATATECQPPSPHDEQRVMTCRYCLRRELNACLRTPAGKSLPTPLFLRGQGTVYRLDFNCKECEMSVVVPPRC